MPDNTLLKHVLNDDSNVDRDRQFGLSRKTRSRRLREILALMRRHRVSEGITPQQLRDILIDLGPSFIKIGQMLSLRSEILPQSYCDALADLQMDCAPMPFEETLRVLQGIYGERFSSIFKEIDPTPLGSASLAQVHKAVLSNGDVVAVKVQRPGVRVSMAQDIDVMRSVARHASRFMKDDQMLDIREVVEELWKTFLEETDFTIEASNLHEFHELNKDVVYVTCPQPYLEYCTESVLVMEYVDGISIRDTEKLVERGYDLDEIGLKVLDNYATQILDHGFFHADPHPGNIFISGGKVVYIDLGMTGRLSAHSRSCLAEIIAAVGDQDGHAVAEGLVRFSLSNPANVDRAQLLADVDAIVGEYGSTSLKDLDLGQMAFSLIELARKDRVELPAVVTMMARGLVTLEGVLDEYMPQGNMVQIIRDHILSQKGAAGMLREELGVFAVEGRRALHGVLVAAGESGELTRMLTRGKVKINMKFVESPEVLGPLSRMVDRLTLGIIIAGLFIGSSVVYYAGIQPVIFGIPVLGFVGYAGAVVLSAWVILDIIRGMRKRR